MPGKDTTGPMGQGSRTGRGMGPCVGGNANGGRGRRNRRNANAGNGLGRMKFGFNSMSNDKEHLQAEKQTLQARLDTINTIINDSM